MMPVSSTFRTRSTNCPCLSSIHLSFQTLEKDKHFLPSQSPSKIIRMKAIRKILLRCFLTLKALKILWDTLNLFLKLKPNHYKNKRETRTRTTRWLLKSRFLSDQLKLWPMEAKHFGSSGAWNSHRNKDWISNHRPLLLGSTL
jgi:hypothetical protein